MPHCIRVNTKHLYNIYTMSDQRLRRWVDVYKCYTNILCLLGYAILVCVSVEEGRRSVLPIQQKQNFKEWGAMAKINYSSGYAQPQQNVCTYNNNYILVYKEMSQALKFFKGNSVWYLFMKCLFVLRVIMAVNGSLSLCKRGCPWSYIM